MNGISKPDRITDLNNGRCIRGCGWNFLGGCALLLVLAAQTAAAQQTPTSGAREDALQEVVVTAEKRAENVQQVPLSLSTLSGQELETQHVVDMTDLTRAIPNLSFSGTGNGAGAGLNNLEIRGISSQAGAATVGIYLDDVSLTTVNLATQGVAEPHFLDIQRVEVLRGPQGTLYGASSMGGTIKFVSNRPDPNGFSGTVSSELGRNEAGGVDYIETGVVNLPLVEGTSALRAAVQVGRRAGYIDLVSPSTGVRESSNINSSNFYVGKLALAWNFSDRLSLSAAVFFQSVQSDDIDVSYLTYPPAPLGPAGSNGANIPLPPNEAAKLVREPGRDRMVVPSITLDYDFGFAKLTSTTAYFWRNFHRDSDATTSDTLGLSNGVVVPSGCAPPPPNGAGCGALFDTFSQLPSVAIFDTTTRKTSEELRIASSPYDPSSGPFTWLGGIYFAHEVAGYSDNEVTPGINNAFSSYGYSPGQVDALVGWTNPSPPFPSGTNYFSGSNYDDKQYGAFGELNYYLLPTLKLTAGLRYTSIDQNFSRYQGGYWTGVVLSTFNATNTSHALTPRFAIGWDTSADNSVYVNIAKGFREGNANRPIPLTPCVVSTCPGSLHSLGLTSVPNSYNPDTLWNYEVGDKARFLDRRIALDTALFYMNWSQLQQSVPLPGGYAFFTNTGSAEIYGAEISVKARPTQNLTLGVAGNYTHARISSPTLVAGIGVDSPIPGVPKWSANVSAENRWPISGNTHAFVNVSWYFTGPSHGTFFVGQPDYDRPSYSIGNVNVGAAFGRLTVSVFVKNLLNEDKIIQRPLVEVTNLAYRPWPRVIGATALFDF
jgi:outer membrane receptor protein involved in Fe transport